MKRISNEEKARVLSIKGSCGAYVTAQSEQLLPTTEQKKESASMVLVWKQCSGKTNK